MGQNGARGFASYHRAHHVCKFAQRWRNLSILLRVGPRAWSAVFAGLADAYGQSLAVENGVAIAKLAAVVDLDLHTPPGARSMNSRPGPRASSFRRPRCALAERSAELFFGNLHVVQENLPGVLGNAAEQGCRGRRGGCSKISFCMKCL